MVGVKVWNDVHKGLPVYVRAEIGSVFLGPLRGAWTLTQAQSRPLLALLKQGQAWGGMRSGRGAGKVALHREK